MQIKRERFLEKIRPFYETDLIKVLVGVRRCGKSILLQQIKEEIMTSGIDAGHIVSVNFEDVKFEKIKTYEKLNKYILSKILDKEKYYLFLDEIQYVKKFEKTLASLRATQNCSIFITGSNSKLLAGKMATLLVGRCIEFHIMPFSFKEAFEYLSLRGQTVSSDELMFDFIRWGGMPLRFSFSKESEVKSYLEQTYNGILEKDVFSANSKIDKEGFIRIAGYIMANAGKEFSGKSIENFFKSVNKEKLDKKKIYRCLEKMEAACLISRVKRFNIVGKEAMSYIEKQYAVDSGFRMLNTNFVNFEDTFFLENIVYNELKTRGYEVFTGKTYKGEVDFVVLDGKKKCFIQVSYYLNNPITIHREFDAYKPIKDASPKYVLSLDRFDFSRDGVEHMNIVDFLLGRTQLRFS